MSPQEKRDVGTAMLLILVALVLDVLVALAWLLGKI